MRRIGTFTVALALALSLGRPAEAASEEHRYIAHDTSVMVMSAISESWGIGVDGVVGFVPTSDTAQITVHDVVARGTVPVGIFNGDGARLVCVPSGYATVISGLVPGDRVWLTILDQTWGRCHSGATVGTITIRK